MNLPFSTNALNNVSNITESWVEVFYFKEIKTQFELTQ